MHHYHRFLLDEDHASLAVELPFRVYGPDAQSANIRRALAIIRETEGFGPTTEFTYLGKVIREC